MSTRKEYKEILHGDTPNVVIPNSTVRFWATATLFALSFLAAIAAMLFSFFPELADGTDIPMRVVAFVNAVVSFAAASFGLVVSLPNVPSRTVINA